MSFDRKAADRRKIIVDIDNTLWDLAPVLWRSLLEANPDLPPPAEWKEWNFWEGNIDKDNLFRILRKIHMRQHLYAPYPESKGFLAALHERKLHITIASHRSQDSLAATTQWLRENELPFDEIHLSRDKSVLFDGSAAIVDDSPVTLDKAARCGLLRTGLLNPWNAHTDHPLFKSLGEVLAYLDERLPSLA